MKFRADRFIQTMLYSSLFYASDIKELPDKGFNIHEDNTMSYITRDGMMRTVKVIEKEIGTLHIEVIDTNTQKPYTNFFMYYQKDKCDTCKIETIHGQKEDRLYCTNCGTFKITN